MSVRRASMLSPPEFFLLDRWGHDLRAAFGHRPYLVGSCERGEPWRDIDVRLVIPDEEYDALIGDRPQRVTAFNVAISLWGQRATGLPIDFQFQSWSQCQEHAGETRNPIGARDGTEFLEQRPIRPVMTNRPGGQE